MTTYTTPHRDKILRLQHLKKGKEYTMADLAIHCSLAKGTIDTIIRRNQQRGILKATFVSRAINGTSIKYYSSFDIDTDRIIKKEPKIENETEHVTERTFKALSAIDDFINKSILPVDISSILGLTTASYSIYDKLRVLKVKYDFKMTTRKYQPMNLWK